MNSNTEDLHDAAPPESARADNDPGFSAAGNERPPLRRPANGRMLAGVSVAIGRQFNIDVTIVRVVFVVLTIVGFTGVPFLGGIPFFLGGIPLYLACWLLIPEEGSDQSIASGFVKNLQSKSR
jgi:phage shock protein PspC (stress-responsive transcriptional regulator)